MERRYYQIEHASPNAIRLGDLTVYVETNSVTDKPMIRPSVAEIDRIISDDFGVSFVCSRSKEFMHKYNVFYTANDYQTLLVVMACQIMGFSDTPIRALIVSTREDIVNKYLRTYRALWDRDPSIRHHPFDDAEHMIADKPEYFLQSGEVRQQFRIGEKGFYEIKPTVLPELKIARPSFRLNFD